MWSDVSISSRWAKQQHSNAHSISSLVTTICSITHSSPSRRLTSSSHTSLVVPTISASSSVPSTMPEDRDIEMSNGDENSNFKWVEGEHLTTNEPGLGDIYQGISQLIISYSVHQKYTLRTSKSQLEQVEQSEPSSSEFDVTREVSYHPRFTHSNLGPNPAERTGTHSAISSNAVSTTTSSST